MQNGGRAERAASKNSLSVVSAMKNSQRHEDGEVNMPTALTTRRRKEVDVALKNVRSVLIKGERQSTAV
jgi:hypothetical protein